LAVIAIFVKDWRYHAAFVSIGLVAQAAWILLEFRVLA
jgi:hypothetical protein